MDGGSGPLIPIGSIKETAVVVLVTVLGLSFTAQVQPTSISTSSVFAIFNNLAFWAAFIGLLLHFTNINAATDAATYSLAVVAMAMACEAAAFICAGLTVNNHSSATSRSVCVAIAVIVCSPIFTFSVYWFFCRRRLANGNAATVLFTFSVYSFFCRRRSSVPSAADSLV